MHLMHNTEQHLLGGSLKRYKGRVKRDTMMTSVKDTWGDTKWERKKQKRKHKVIKLRSKIPYITINIKRVLLFQANGKTPE